MDPKAITSQLERNIASVNMLLDQQQKKIQELEQLATYYKNRNANLEADFIEMAATIEILEKAKAEQIKS
jgi:septal ring factor EnvC (AmiA/AmiB activator)